MCQFLRIHHIVFTVNEIMYQLFRNNYNGFLASQLLAQNPNTPDEKRFQTTISLDQPVSSYGWALGFEYKMLNNYELSANISYNDVNKVDNPGFQIQFNTSDYRYNISIGNRKLTNKLNKKIHH